MDAGDHVVAVVVDLAVAGFVECFDSVEVQGGAEGFVEELDGRDDVGVGLVARGERLQGVERLLYTVTLLPVNVAIAATVVEAIL